MERTELLQQLKQPRLIADLAAGAIAVLGLFGCFSETQVTKNLSLAALMAGVGTLGANTAIASLYAEIAANVLDKELSRHGHALQLSESHVTELTNKVEEWKAFWGQKYQEFEALNLRLLQTQTALATAQQEATEAHHYTDLLQASIDRLEAQIDSLNEQGEQERQRGKALQRQLTEAQTALTAALSDVEESRRHMNALQTRFDALVSTQQQERQQFHHAFESLAISVKQSMSEAVMEYRDRLLSAIESSARQRPGEYRDRLLKGAKESASQTDIVPQLQRLAGEVKHVAGDHLNHIANLSHFSDPQSFLKEAFSLLQQEFEELSALKVKYRNTLNTGDKLIFYSEIANHQTEADRLRLELNQFQQNFILRSQHEAILSEFRVKKDEAFQSVVEQAEALEIELNGDTDQYVQKLLNQIDLATREIAKLKEQIETLRQPHNFNPATREDLRMGNQIIKYFWMHGILLDRAGSDYRKHEATLQFHTDRNPRLILPADLNEHADKLPQVTRCLNKPEFKYDSETGLMSVWVQLSQKPPVDTAAVLKTVGTAEDFLKYLSCNPISYRIIGDKGRGKTPLMAVMVSHFLKTGGRKGNVPNGMKMPKLLVGVSYPNADFSQKDKGRYPLEPFLFARNDEQCKKAIGSIYQDYQRRRDPAMSQLVDQFFQLWVIDEADNTLDFSAEGSASKMRSIFNDGGHGNTGWIFAGQSVNTRVLKGWTNDDRKKSVEIILEAAKIKAWANEYGSDYYGEDRLKSMLANVDAIRSAIEKENEAIGDEAKRLRLALVADPISPKLFLLPNLDSVDFDVEAYGSVRIEADAVLAAGGAAMTMGDSSNPDSAVAATLPADPFRGGRCPKCETGILSKVKSSRGSRYYVCDTCGKSTSESVLAAQSSINSAE
ncbi:hypothetical protein IQ268_28650 [Oculatella sp. LEGE 06141]|uniref:hypothetical protein n=1 Tax=Oculatella sp. LEGE 06141 TaxID=1828648 RepID=UPI0018812279|nr:hypothetical protein [Oculatella sp. LEGE 06141]MBE9182524.1 hypothetical protein [Oculatella sp. LEGE 06141]